MSSSSEIALKNHFWWTLLILTFAADMTISKFVDFTSFMKGHCTESLQIFSKLYVYPLIFVTFDVLIPLNVPDSKLYLSVMSTRMNSKYLLMLTNVSAKISSFFYQKLSFLRIVILVIFEEKWRQIVISKIKDCLFTNFALKVTKEASWKWLMFIN